MKTYIILFALLTTLNFSNNSLYAQGNGPYNFDISTDDLSQYPCLNDVSLEFDGMMIPLTNLVNGQSLTINDMSTISLFSPGGFGLLGPNVPFTYSTGTGLVSDKWMACFTMCCDGVYIEVCVSFIVTRNGSSSLHITAVEHGDC